MYLLGLVVLPMLGAIVCLLSATASKWVALGTSCAGLLLAGVVYCAFDASHAQDLQFAWSIPWIAPYGISVGLAIDGLSLPLVFLTKFMVPIALIASFGEARRSSLLTFCFLMLDAFMTGTFLATDIFLFYVFWEAMLIPMFLLIGIWGSQERVFASLKFFIYTFAGSILMLVAILWVVKTYGDQQGAFTGHIRSLYGVKYPSTPILWGLSPQEWIFWGFTLAFLIKVPSFPFHTWLPDAHVQAPTGGSILLAAVLLKMGTYGLLRFSIPLCPEAFQRFAPVLAVLSLIGILYTAWIAFVQTDIKKLVAYSSVSHLGFVVLGICAMSSTALTGAVLQMVNHGLSTGALFFLVGALYERRHSRNFADFGGLAHQLPWYAFFLVFASAASMAVPGLNGFVGEFLILMGTFLKQPIWAGIAVLGVIFGAVYTLSMLRRVLFGGPVSAENRLLKDLSVRDWAGLVPLCVFMLCLGILPNPFLAKFRGALDNYWNTHGAVHAKVKRRSVIQFGFANPIAPPSTRVATP